MSYRNLISLLTLGKCIKQYSTFFFEQYVKSAHLQPKNDNISFIWLIQLRPYG